MKDMKNLVKSLQSKNSSGEKIGIDYFPLTEKDDFNVNTEILKETLDNNNYSLLIICNPNNPTGKFLPLEQMEEIVKKCNEKN